VSKKTGKEYTTFEAFWPFYVQEHKNPLNRRLHFIGTSLALGCVANAALRRKPRWLLLAPLAGYFFAWIGHFLVEKNRPATFKYPLESLRGDFKMFGLMATGRMNEELQRVLLDAEMAAEKTPASDSSDGLDAEDIAYELGKTLEDDDPEDEEDEYELEEELSDHV
jgi:hypothetical protein